MGEFDTTLGALCVSYALASGLFGAMSMQSVTYFHKFPKDSLWLKTLVALLWAFDTIQLVLAGNGLYFWMVTNYNNADILEDPSPWSFNVAIFLTNTIVFIVELFLARRVYILSDHNILLTAIIVVLSCCYYGLQIAVKVKLWQFQKLSLLYRVQKMTEVSLACAAVADLTIAISLSVCLRKSRTGVKITDSIVNKLVLYAMNTGLLTSVIVLIDMICFLTMPRNFIHLGFNMISGNLYTNSLLATLNFRDVVRNNMNNTMNLNTLSLSAMPASPLNISSANGADDNIQGTLERKFHDSL
ncbi:hypothetical protein MSAN_00241600 [Mycena sanguinolenta]|uniref:DUF6534 domain-containing protein n=1 Tax=Mycena sanguinolenta TaxID=230812 RepID=A0A8H6ZKP6_9AGAR|nr:hypothetical protein MSAN_00241600 [Mycena sanguinolenta]